MKTPSVINRYKGTTAFIVVYNILCSLTGVGIFLLIWFIAAKSFGIERILPTPLNAIRRTGELLVSGKFWYRIATTLARTLLAFVISFVSALALALICENSVLKKIVAPIMSIIRAVPTMVVIVLFLIWTDALITPVLVVALVLFPTFYSSFSMVIARTDKALIDSVRVMGANKLQIIYYVQLPLLTKSMIESTASGISLGFKLAVSAEILAQTRDSVGQFMQEAQQYVEIDLLMGSALIVCVICIAIEILINLPLARLKYL